MNKITLLLFTFLMSFCGYSQLALEGFEGTFPPPGWAVINVAGPNFTWEHSNPLNPSHLAYAGTYTAYVQRENATVGTTEDWLVTPQFTAPPVPELHFFSKLSIGGNQGTIYQVRVSNDPAQLLQGEYDIIQTWTETEINPSQESWFEKVVTIPASYAGQQIYVAFVMLGDNGDRWFIDNVSVVEKCQAPVAQLTTGITQNSAILNWTNPGNETSWEIELVEATAAFTGVANITYNGLPPYTTTTPLLPGTNYKYKVRAVCGINHVSDWSNPINFTTLFEPPVNDNCANATALTVNPTNICAVTTHGTVNAATASPEASTCAGTEDDDVWYTFVATNTTHLISLLNLTGSTTNLDHVIYSGSCGSLIQMSCQAANTSTATGLTIGSTYYIRVYSNSATAQTTQFDICIGTPPPPPVNDECAGATAVPVNPDLTCAVFATGTIYSATASPQANSCTGTDDDDIWFSFVATNPQHTINLNNITGGTTLLNHVVYSGACGSLTELYCSDPNNSIAGNLTIGETYYIRVYSSTATAGQTSVFDVCIGTPPPPPVNDNCADATTVPVNPNLVCTQTASGTIAWSTPSPEGGTTCTGTEDDDIWFEFVATSTTHTITLLNITGSTTLLNHVVYSGACGSLTQLYCSDPNNSIAGNLTIGETYLIRVYSSTATGGQTSAFDVCVATPPPPPVNDECAAATVAPVNADLNCAQTVPGTIAWSTPSIEPSTCAGTEDDDVWYTFVATNAIHTINLNNITGGTTDLNHAVYTGDVCGTMTQLYCATANNSIASGLTVGTTYKLRVYSATATGGQTTNFNVCIGTPPPPPANDDCAAAIVAPVNPDLSCAQTVPGTIAWATASPEASTCAGTEDDDVWYQFVATNTVHTINLNNVAGSVTDLNHALYSGDNCGTMTQMYCATPNNSVAQGLVIGQTYKIRIWTTTATLPQTTTFNVCVGTPPPPPANDECANAVVVPVNPTQVCNLVTPGTVEWTTPSAEGGTTCAGTEDDDVWYQFVATNTTHLISLLNITGSVTDLNHALYSGDQCGTMTLVYCEAANNSTATGLVVGQTYKIRIWTATATIGQNTSLNLCVGTPPPPPSNDECAAATPVPVNPTMECVQTAAGTLYSATQSSQAITCAGTANDDVWYEFVATNTAHIITIDVNGTTNINHVLYQGDQCGSLTQVLCSDPNISIAQNLTVGATYKIRVYSSLATAQTTDFTVCVSTPPTPGTNDACASSIVVPVNQNSSCALFVSGTVFGATASPEASTCGGTEDDDVWYHFVATHTEHLISLQNIEGTVTALNHALYAGDICGSLTQLLCSTDGSIQATGLTIGDTYKIRVFSAAATVQAITFDVCVRIPNTPISVNDTQYTIQQLVTDVLIDSDCALVSNITSSTGSNFGAANGIGYFDASSSEFPFQNGVILSTSSINEAAGGAAGSGTNWPGDDQLNAIVLAADPTQDNGLENASILEFDFVPLTNQFTFDFMFASDEYGTFQCGFTDAFAFILTGPSPSTASQNLAVIPGTNIPVSVTTIRNGNHNANCESANEDYFAQYNANDPAAAAISYNGQTVVMQASADVIPGQTYHIKLVIADYGDTIVNSAVFLGGGSFDIGDVDLGGDLLVDDGTGLCDEETITLNTDLDPNNFTFVWEKDDVVIPTATGPTLVVTEPGVYSVVASFPNIACSYQGEVTIEFFPDVEDVTGEPADLTYCDATGFHAFDLTVNTDAILAPLTDPDAYTVDFYLTEANALGDIDPIINFTNFTNTIAGGQTIYVRILNQEGGCVGIKSFDLIIQDLTPQFDITDDFTVCGTEVGTITVTPGNFDPTSPNVGFVWTYNGNPLPDTGATITTTQGPGAYQVTINNTECTATATVNVTATPAPVATINYADSPYCSNETIGTVTLTGSTGGTYSAVPVTGTGTLAISSTTGDIDIAGSDAGTYTVTYFIAGTASCDPLTTTAQVTIFEAPAAVISYDGTPYCSNEGTAMVTLTGITGGTYSSTGGLIIDSLTGDINLAASTEGTYTVTYTIAATADCAGDSFTTSVTITALPVATINYAGTPYCSNAGTATVTRTGNAGGTYTGVPVTGTGTLVINASTGDIDLDASTAGDYIVTYTIAAAGGCPAVNATANITITELPEAEFSYDAVSFCQNHVNPIVPAFNGVSVGGTFSVVSPNAGGLTINPANGHITASTSAPDTYTVRNTIVAANGCPAVIHDVIVTILPAPVGTFNYEFTAYCQEGEDPSPFVTGTAGTFSATPAGLSINPLTGEINLAESEPRTYIVVNTVPATAECPEVEASFTVTINATPVFTLIDGCEDNVYSLEVEPVNGSFDPDVATITWAGPGGFSQTGAIIDPTDTGMYTVTVVSAGCTYTDSFNVDSTSCFIQRGISPGDGDYNDNFDLSALNVTKLSIFNRYGQEVYTYGNYTNQWSGQDKNGNELPTGTYFYSIERANGETKTGWVYINRMN